MLRNSYNLMKARKDPAAAKKIAVQIARDAAGAPVEGLAFKARFFFIIAAIAVSLLAAGSVYLALNVHGIFYILTFVTGLVGLLIWLAYRALEAGYERAKLLADKVAARAARSANSENAA